ncbi:MAG: LVIVD repeat-containing protein [Acidobacteriota bacterium]
MQYAYVGDDFAGLRIIDISDPTNPVEAGFYNTPGIVSDVAVSGGVAYVCDGFFGLRVIDVSNPASPSEIGLLPTSEQALTVTISEDTAYVGREKRNAHQLTISESDLLMPSCVAPHFASFQSR